MRLLLPIISLYVTVILALTPSLAQTQPAPVPASSFTETFDGAPATPAPYADPAGFDVYVQGFNQHETSVLAPGIRGSTAQHGPNCEPPGFPYTATNSHPITNVRDSVFICNGHIMTSPGLAGYAAVYLTIPALLDFSAGEATFTFDMSTLVTSARDWPEVTIMPLSGYHLLAFNQHQPPDSIDLSSDGCACWKIRQRTNGQPNNTDEHGASISTTGLEWNTILSANGVPLSLARRDTFKLKLTRSTIEVCMPQYNYAGQPACIARPGTPLLQTLDPNVWHDQAVIMLSHRVYNPEKACSADDYDSQSIVHDANGDQNCPPNTWHWDNLNVSPSVPFQIVETHDPLTSVEQRSPGITNIYLQRAAPANATLHFVYFGNVLSLQVSTDDGKTWRVPTPQPAVAGAAHEELGDYYESSIEPGVDHVLFRGSNGGWGAWAIEGVSVWGAPGNVPAPVATNTATPFPTLTATPVPTDTPVPADTATATPTATITPVATDTPVPTSTPAPPIDQPTASPVATQTPAATVVPAPGAVCYALTTRKDDTGEHLDFARLPTCPEPAQ